MQIQRNRILIAATTIIILLLLLFTTSNRITTSLPWRKLLHEHTRLAGDYQARLHICDINPEDIVAGKYCVFLHSGYPLDEHKSSVGPAVDFEAAVEHVFSETHRHGLYYCGALSDDALGVVRADIGVDMVECVVRAYLIE